MQILNIEIKDAVRTPRGQLRFQPLHSGDVEIIETLRNNDDTQLCIIPKDELHRVAEFLFSQSPEIKAEMAAGRELSS
jgi:nicotinamide mononucleotide adenylyltransferase